MAGVIKDDCGGYCLFRSCSYHVNMPDNLTETLSFKITKKRKLELIKICNDLNIPISRACRAAIGNFIAYRKRFKGGYYLCNKGGKKKEGAT